MRHWAFAKLYDRATGLICHQVPVNGTTEDLVEPVRSMFIDSMTSFGYEGFSRTIDDIFHQHSTYVYITDSMKIVMTCRVTSRPPGAVIPFEIGVREGGGAYHLDGGERIIDINTFTYARGYYDSAMSLLTAGLGHYAMAYDAGSAYCLYDVANEKIKRAYLSIGFVLSSRFPEPIYFPTFCRRINGKLVPVRWRVMEWDRVTIESHARGAAERYELINPV